MSDRAAQPEAPATGELEVTPEMIRAGVGAYYECAVSGWEVPDRGELIQMLREAYLRMAKAAAKHR